MIFDVERVLYPSPGIEPRYLDTEPSKELGERIMAMIHEMPQNEPLAESNHLDISDEQAVSRLLADVRKVSEPPEGEIEAAV